MRSGCAAAVGVTFGHLYALVDRQARTLARRDELSLDLLATLRDGRFIRANQMWHEVLGYPEGELNGERFLAYVHPADLGAAVGARSRVAGGDPVSEQPLRLRHADGRYLWIDWSAQIDQRDRVIHLAGRDVTRRRSAEARLAEQQLLLEQVVRERTAELERRTRELDHAHREDLRRLALVAEYRDDDTAAHTERVGTLSALIAERLGLPDDEVALLREAAPLHDIGKIGTPDAILLKPDPLSSAEWAVMQQHTELGARILAGSDGTVLEHAAPIALHHHERWDGNGYPHGLAGEEIPLAARIVAVADTFDALVHDRPYKPAWPIAEAISEIRQLAARQFDPRVVEAFCEIPIAALRAGSVTGRPRRALRAVR